MPAIWSIPNLLLALGLESYAGYLLLVPDAGSTLLLALLHVLASVCVAFAAALHLPVWYSERFGYRWGLFFTLALLMPGFGLIGIVLAMLPALFYPRERRETLWKDIPVPELPFRPVLVSGRPSYGEGGLASVMRSARDPERRVRAVIAARQISDKLAVPLLQEALKDPVDDVRLFAYSVLDSKETRINERITDLLSGIDKLEGFDKARSHYALAQNYWEMAFLGLATGNSLDYVLEQAEKHALLSASLGWSGPDIEFMIGRIYLRRKNYAEAEKAFCSSMAHGALESAILPFLSEIAFEQRKFIAVREILEQLDDCCDGHSPIPAVVQSWKLA